MIMDAIRVWQTRSRPRGPNSSAASGPGAGAPRGRRGAEYLQEKESCLKFIWKNYIRKDG